MGELHTELYCMYGWVRDGWMDDSLQLLTHRRQVYVLISILRRHTKIPLYVPLYEGRFFMYIYISVYMRAAHTHTYVNVNRKSTRRDESAICIMILMWSFITIIIIQEVTCYYLHLLVNFKLCLLLCIFVYLKKSIAMYNETRH